METYNKLLKAAFLRCYGLQSILQDILKGKETKANINDVINEISIQSGLRKDYIKNNLKQISEL